MPAKSGGHQTPLTRRASPGFGLSVTILSRGLRCAAQIEDFWRSHSVPRLRRSYGCAIPAGCAFGVARNPTALPAREDAGSLQPVFPGRG